MDLGSEALFLGYVMKFRRSSMDVGVAPDLEVTLGPEDRIRTRRSPGNPEVFLDHEGTRRFSLRFGDHNWSPETIWEPGDSLIGPETVVGTWRSHGNPEVLRDVMTPMCLRQHRGSILFLRFIFRTLRPYRKPEVLPQILRPLLGTLRLYGNLEGPYSAFLGKTTTGTCLDFAFCRSEAGHYRVPMLYSTSAGSH
ncbi:hypothetical protein F2Q69_00059551 [Brassica cretica]|uniref:Uncharacterized protein n=1 Tax=Brassica cretica TaxID=69181 RepID=A0A8S9RJ36_BRACR|nr:hypothetical protein F2Q69_00059551 [Brassica cretica]